MLWIKRAFLTVIGVTVYTIISIFYGEDFQSLTTASLGLILSMLIWKASALHRNEAEVRMLQEQLIALTSKMEKTHAVLDENVEVCHDNRRHFETSISLMNYPIIEMRLHYFNLFLDFNVVTVDAFAVNQ